MGFALWRDNTPDSSTTVLPVMASVDFYATILEKVDPGVLERLTIAGEQWRRAITAGVEAEMRVYVGEDARVKDSPQVACTAVVSVIDQWVDVQGMRRPGSLVMLTYVQLGGKGRIWAYRYDFYHENPYAYESIMLSSILGTVWHASQPLTIQADAFPFVFTV